MQYSGENMINAYDIKEPVQKSLNINSSWLDFSHYFMFLTLKNEGCTKSSSGSLTISFPQHFQKDFNIIAELGGYDCKTLSRHHYIEGSNEIELKETLIKLFEAERIAYFNQEEYI